MTHRYAWKAEIKSATALVSAQEDGCVYEWLLLDSIYRWRLSDKTMKVV